MTSPPKKILLNLGQERVEGEHNSTKKEHTRLLKISFHQDHIIAHGMKVVKQKQVNAKSKKQVITENAYIRRLTNIPTS